MKPAAQVWIVLGTRPEVIKLAPVVAALRRDGIRCRIVVTGQHRAMLAQTLSVFGLKANVDLRLMRQSQELNDFGARALERLGRLLRASRPDLVLVQGDTTTALMAALAAFHERVPVGHIEAGLRSFDRDAPFPEELNRMIVDSVAALHFAPTPAALRNLIAAGIPARGVLVTGNTVVDALRWAQARRRPAREPALRRALSKIPARSPIALVTTHRRESFGATLAGLCRSFSRLVATHDRLHLLFPLHPNPSAGAAARRLLRHPRIHLLPPLDYLDMVLALRRCRFVMTDSGGLQEEAPCLGKPTLVLRRVTERPEATRAGLARVAGVEPGRVFALASRLLNDRAFYRSMARKVCVYGDGRASRRIAQGVRWFLGQANAKPAPFKPGP